MSSDSEEKPEEKPELPELKHEVIFPKESKLKNVKNKILRNQQYQKLKKEKKKAKRDSKKTKLNEDAPKKTPHTIESLRVRDEAALEDIDEDDELVQHDIEHDEFSKLYAKEYEPKVLITYADNPMRKTRIFGRELRRIIPNSISLYRNRSSVKKIVKGAIQKEFTDIVIINENRKEPDGLLVIHLPDGPTAHFKVSNVKITTELRRNHKDISSLRPEVILNNFSTRLGNTVARMLAALFHHSPEFEGKRAVAFHNQRDYVFFRHYRYTFDEDGKKARLRELGPRFTLRLRSLQKGTFDSKYGQYEFIVEGRRHSLESNRRKFYL